MLTINATGTIKVINAKARLLALMGLLLMGVYAGAQAPSKQDTTGGKVEMAGGRTDTAGGRTDTAGGKFNQTLSSYTVQGTQPFVQHRSGKVIVHVTESPLAAGGNASEVIRHIPGVDGMQWHGRTLLVLIDGRSTGLKGDDLKTILDGMAAGTIDRMELIGSPSAKYDAAGGAVLNIITVKMKEAGVNGTMTFGVGAGRYAKFTDGVSVNYRAGKLNLYVGYDYLHGKPFYDYFSFRQADAGKKIVETTYGARRSDDHSYRIGMDYDIDAKSSFGLLVKGMVNVKKENASNHSLLSDVLSGQDSLSNLSTTGYAHHFTPSANAWYKRTFDSAGSALNINADYLHYAKTWNEDFLTLYSDTKGAAYRDPSVLRDHSHTGDRILSFSADYIHPTPIGQFEAGVKSSFTTTDNDILWEMYNGGGWSTDKGKSNHFLYKETIYAAYLNYGRNWKKWGLKLGMRAEQTNSEGRSVTLDQADRTRYFSLFPNAAIQYALSENQQLGLSYRKGIERFGFDIVNPFVRYINQYSYSRGNPNIRPSLSHNWALSYSWKEEISASVSYGHFLDALGTVYARVDSGHAVISTETNLGSADQLEVDLTYAKSLWNGKWTSSNSIGTLYAQYNTSTAIRQPGTRWTVLLSSDNEFIFGKGWKVQLSGMYYSPFLLGVYSYRSRFSMDLGVSKTILQNKGKLALNVSDVFNSYVNRFDVISYGIALNNRQKMESQVVKLVFTYRFGGKSVKNSSNRKTGIEDLRQRMGGN